MSTAPPKIFQRLVGPDGTADKVWYAWFSGLVTAATAAAPVDLSGYLPTTTTAQGHGYIRHTGSLADGAVFFDLSTTYPGQTSITTLGTIDTGTWQGTAVAAPYGGTGQTSYTIGDLLYASSTTALSKLAAGTNNYVLTSNGPGVAPSWKIAAGGVADGDKGDITVTSSGSVWTVDNDAITYAKIQNVSATDKILGRSTAGAGDIEEITCTAAARALLDDTTAAAMRATLGISTGGAIGGLGQPSRWWDFWEHGLTTSSATGASYVSTPTTGVGMPVGYFSNGSLSFIDSEAGHQGIGLAQTGNSAVGYLRCCFTAGNRIILGGGEIRIVAVIRVPVLSTSSQRFEVSMALQNGITGVTRLLDLRYKDDVNSGNWHMRCIDSGGTTTVNGATAPTANTWTRIELVINAAGTSVEAFVDNVSQGTSTTNIPNADSLALFMSINKSVGATTSLLHIDYVEITQTFTTPR